MVIYQQQRVADENMSSNLTSASFGEAPSASSIQQQYCSYADSMNPKKKRRSLPGNPDPEAEVVALSPKTLMATNRFVCEICNKGFQRDQNLQLHRRGHNLSWKLKQRSNKLEAPRKKVYVCPEATCVHHDPSRALGDLTGIKKHFSRRHGEKKWKCERCSKKYAVQSDWKAHSKICGTREYRCDCGTLFSRRDSFITHRAFCDALAQESARGAITANPLSGQQHQLLFSQPMTSHDKVFPFQQVTPALHSQFPHSLMRAAEAPSASIMNGGGLRGLPQDLYLIKREQQEQHKHFGGMRPDVPQWLACQGSTSTLSHLEQNDCSPVENIAEQSSIIPLPPPYHATASFPSSSISPRVLATALLQKAAQMGATMSRPPNNMAQMSAHTTNARVVVDTSSSGFGHGGLAPPPLLQGVAAAASSLPSALGFDGPFEDAFGGLLGSKSEVINGGMDVFVRSHGRSTEEGGGVGRGRAGGNDEMTRDFLGLEGPFSQQQGAGGILGLTGLEHCMPPHSYI